MKILIEVELTPRANLRGYWPNDVEGFHRFVLDEVKASRSGIEEACECIPAEVHSVTFTIAEDNTP